jgi:DNA mismatch repair protein MutS2
MDVLQAKVRLAKELDARTIDVGTGAPLRLKGTRHPILALESDSVQEVDLELGPGQKGLIISGGNSGGKTVSLKTLGLVALMARSALPVPVSPSSSLPFWRNMHVFLGDEQSLQEHLSTFTAQIESFQQAWPIVDDTSLIILDEFGAGTDPSQGAALAQAVIDCLVARGAWVAAATHFPALKAYALARDEVRAASVLFDPDTKQPLFRIAYEQVGSSQALDVAREHGMPQEILERAAEYLLLDGDDSSSLLERLNRLAHEREQELKSLREEQEAVGREKARLKARMDSELKRLQQEVTATSRDILQQWKQDRIGRKQAMKELGRIRKDLHHQAREAPSSRAKSAQAAWEDLQPGDGVLYALWNKKGTILDKDDRKQRVKIDLGGVNIWVDPGEISPASWPAQEVQSSRTHSEAREGSGFLLDLRGQRMEEARSSLIRFLDQALLQGRSELEVIHGRGTGVLRQVVHEVLQQTRGVMDYDLAPENRGGDGVTLVELR